MRLSPITTLGLATVSLLPPVVAQTPMGDDNTMTVNLDWEAGIVGPAPTGRVPLKERPPKDVKLPSGMSKPLYARIVMGGKTGLAIALDAHATNPRLWLDRDFDGDLAEHRASRFPGKGGHRHRTDTLLIPHEDATDPSIVSLRSNIYITADRATLQIRLDSHRRGTAVLGGRLRTIAVVDGNFDGRFDSAEKDRIYLDLDGDGQLDATGKEPRERVLPGEAFRVGEEGWTVKVATPSGRAVEFTRAKTVPPARTGEWEAPRRYMPKSGEVPRQPKATFEELCATYEREKSKPYADRWKPIDDLGRVGTVEAFDFLVGISKNDPHARIQTNALKALGHPALLAERGAQLLEMARGAEKDRAHALAEALFKMAHPEREALYVAMVGSNDQQAVHAASRYLSVAPSEAGRAALLDAARTSEDQVCRLNAYQQGVRHLPGGPPLEYALGAARDEYNELRAWGVRDLATLGHPDALKIAIDLAGERPVGWGVDEALVEVLGAAGTPDAVQALIGLLDDEDMTGRTRKALLDQLRFVRAPDSVAAIAKELKSKTPAIRAAAAEVLAAIPEPPITAALIKQAKREKEPDVLPRMLEALGDHGDEKALSTLLKYAKSRKRPQARNAAVLALARLGFHLPKVHRFFLSLLDSRRWTDRVLALDAAGVVADSKLTKKVVQSLDHNQWQVRLTAVEALDKIRTKPAVEPLIARLANEEEQRVRDAIADTLLRLTGMNLYDNSEMWQRWWTENGKTFEIPSEIPVPPERIAGETSAGFYGLPIASERVVFIIDQSGSMMATGSMPEDYKDEPLNRLQIAIRETIGALNKLNDRSLVNVIMFHTTIHPWEDELKRLAPNRKKLIAHLERQDPAGGTNIYDGLELALRMEKVDTIYLLSDGTPGAGKYVTTPDILRAVRRENQTKRIAIHCVAVGMESELLRKLALENGGKYVRK